MWIIACMFYFLVFFTVTYCYVNGFDDPDDVVFDDPGFGSSDVIRSEGAVSTSDTFDEDSDWFSNVLAVASIMTGINSGNVVIGVPALFRWFFSFIFFYIPLFILAWSIYMAVPAIH